VTVTLARGSPTGCGPRCVDTSNTAVVPLELVHEQRTRYLATRLLYKTTHASKTQLHPQATPQLRSPLPRHDERSVESLLPENR